MNSAGHGCITTPGAISSTSATTPGIFGSEIALGLGVVASDVNRDGWPDLYVANDFFEQDYLYINNHDGTFTESIARAMPSISYYSMGMDIADVNNDGWPDVYTTDMLPEDDLRLKLTSSFESWEVYQQRLRNNFHHQFMRNMLQLNNGDGTFSDIGQLANVARTDWSWGALIADLDLDGYKDIFVTNGILRDVTSQDYIAFLGSQQTMRAVTQGPPRGLHEADHVDDLDASAELCLPQQREPDLHERERGLGPEHAELFERRRVRGSRRRRRARPDREQRQRHRVRLSQQRADPARQAALPSGQAGGAGQQPLRDRREGHGQRRRSDAVPGARADARLPVQQRLPAHLWHRRARHGVVGLGRVARRPRQHPGRRSRQSACDRQASGVGRGEARRGASRQRAANRCSPT